MKQEPMPNTINPVGEPKVIVTEGESEFVRFERLARGLVSVPKKELDEQRKADERHRA